MFCPHCGQQQATNEIRFCSRCGFPLGAVSQLLANGGVLAGLSDETSGPTQPSPRRRGVRQGALLIFIGLILTPILAILTAELNLTPALVALCAIITIFGGLLRMAYAAVLESGTPSANISTPVEIPAYVPPVNTTPRTFSSTIPDQVAAQNALPPAQSIPVSHYVVPRTTTGELAPPPSVTENTTRLLKDPPEN